MRPEDGGGTSIGWCVTEEGFAEGGTEDCGGGPAEDGGCGGGGREGERKGGVMVGEGGGRETIGWDEDFGGGCGGGLAVMIGARHVSR